MWRSALCWSVVVAVGLGVGDGWAQKRDRAEYRVKYRDPVIEEMKKLDKERKKKREAATEKIQKQEKKRKEREKKAKKELLLEMKGIAIPPSPAVFQRVFHFPPVAQYLTGSCWSFSSTSFLESEVARLTKRRVKLSEMHTVYYEYLEKARRYLEKRGHSYVNQGSENNATVRIFKRYGAVPLAAYPGVRAKDGRHDHSALMKRIKDHLDLVKRSGHWEVEDALASIRVLLDRTLGRPPERFTFEGRSYTPRTFVREVLRLDLDAYVEVMSTKLIPFWTVGEFKVPDNWWRSRDYHNVPLDVFYRLIVQAVQSGRSVAIGGDVSEPGRNGFADAAVIPSYDIPQEYIDQDSREYRIAAKSTTDDHGVHLVGYAAFKGRDWFLIKDSGRSARWGKAKGYYYFRDDFIKLKMLTFTVHRDVLGKLMARFKPAP